MDNSQRLNEWDILKKQIDNSQITKKVIPKKIYWVNVGQNIGSEVYGKNMDFTRPVLVIKSFFNKTFLGIPLSSKTSNKSGFLYHKFVDSKGTQQVALLGQIRVFDNKRRLNYKSSVDDNTFEAIKQKLKEHIID
ncbi:toxin-antitoxin system protein [Helicobacter sp. MIT 00-7814]|nr:toxin-antitoxin system protein [Helicobacter sp. MIT 99-10781]RDU52547.1 toxin-antitoxin system protein [Helicobacter sp. MIT 00-7814]